MTNDEIEEMADWYAREERDRRAVSQHDRAARHVDDVDDSRQRCIREARVSPMAVVTGFAVTVGLAVAAWLTLAPADGPEAVRAEWPADSVEDQAILASGPGALIDGAEVSPDNPWPAEPGSELCLAVGAVWEDGSYLDVGEARLSGLLPMDSEGLWFCRTVS